MEFEKIFLNLSRKRLQNNVLKKKSENLNTIEQLESKETRTVANICFELLHAIYVVRTIENSSLRGLSSCEFENITLVELQHLFDSELDVQISNAKWIVSWDEKK